MVKIYKVIEISIMFQLFHEIRNMYAKLSTLPPLGDHSQENVSLHPHLPVKRLNEQLVLGLGTEKESVVCRFGESMRT